MCYLLIGNISAFISDDCTEPLVNARLRVYLPDGRCPTGNDPKNYIYNGPGQLTSAQVEAKQERLLAETTLDERGNFTLTWEQLHLFTEPLELDISLHHMPEQAGIRGIVSNYHLSTVVPHWTRSGQRYVAAYAYVIPVECWSQIRANYGTWIIAGTVRRLQASEGQSQLRVEAYNVGNHRLLGCARTDDQGKYQLRFSKKELTSKWSTVSEPGHENGPDIYFKVYRDKQLVWEEDPATAMMPGRRSVAPCTTININIRESAFRKTPGWLGSWAVTGRKSSLVRH
ncbi:hypothetical protein [Chitinophaga rhizophila]|uniref:Carboxypeptidase regulatory-like domain-containing protein n=1 Tax=Chitinophaga rhizophila TaxID=2866212 RepID=A0ABS7GIU9_9BACT|nr:hypothetical protein [Chitinophaga rhizophila]MBW8687626.1 hypothetical protein [Chitinophaga rhizophila]